MVETTGIKFPDFKGHGPSLRSQRMKLPVSVGQKKAKAIEGFLNELGLGNLFFHGCINVLFGFLFSDSNPIPSEEICQSFNELRSDMVLLYELRTALSNCMYELQSLRHQYEAQCPGKVRYLSFKRRCYDGLSFAQALDLQLGEQNSSR